MENLEITAPDRANAGIVGDTFRENAGIVDGSAPASTEIFINLTDTTPSAVSERIFDSVRHAIFLVNEDGTIARANPATLELTGYTVHELIGLPVEILFRRLRSFARLFARSLKDESFAKTLEIGCMRKDGSQFPVSVSTSKIVDDTTGTWRLVCVAQDITNRKRLEAESRAISRIIDGVSSTANLDELLHLVHRSIKKILYAENCFVALYDPATELLTMQFWVDKYDSMPAPLKIGRSLSAYVFREGRSMLLTDDDVKKLIAAGDVESVGTDSPIWLGVPLKTPAGVIGVLVVQDYHNSDTYTQQDVELLTSVADQIALAIERKRAQEALRLSQERFELVTRATSDAVWDWNLETDGIWWNEGFQKLFGYSPEEVGSEIESWTTRIHPDDLERVTHDIHRHIDSGHHNWTDEYRFRRSDGSYAFVIDRGYVVYNNENKPVRMLGSMMDVTDRKSLEEQLTHQALHDPLTKIANRVLFRDRVDHALAKLSRDDGTLAVLFLDLDDFKAINDSLGHAAGDKLLIGVADRLQECLRNTDTAARLGGDEFAVLVDTVHRADEAEMIAERINTVFKQPFLIDGKEVRVSSSIGIASSSKAASNSEALLRNADLAMYMAKNQGKRQAVVFQPEMHEALMERIEMEEELRRGIENREFTLHYQPILALESKEIIGMEALVRWCHPRYGLFPPLKFIPLAEETNLIVPLGEWVLIEACRQMQQWRNEYPGECDTSITVNISIRQFQQDELVKIVQKALDESGLPPEYLILEITESFMLQDTEATILKLHELKRLGIRLAIDDFGTGYSSLSYLQRFPIDILKIDKSFVDKVGLGTEGSAVARAIIMMGDSLNLKTIAEGIESPEQMLALRELGCDAGQGFHFAKPLSSEDMKEFLTQRHAKPEKTIA
ncbi:MAG: EAL domain-containing protein [Pyrinomonadaceae bacterium]